MNTSHQNRHTNNLFSYDQQLAEAYTSKRYVDESGAFNCTITSAKWTTSPNGASALELNIETDLGLKSNFIRIYYQSGTLKNHQNIIRGIKLINAIMGCTNVQSLSHRPGQDGSVDAPELIGKSIGLVLQKVIKQGAKTDGSDRISYNIVMPYCAKTQKTLKEKAENLPAKAVNKILVTLHDRIEPAPSSSSSESTISTAEKRSSHSAVESEEYLI